MTDTKINKALERLAGGYSVTEVTKEYADRDGELVLVKKKETKRFVPPDMKAITYLMGNDSFDGRTDEELEAEKARLEEMARSMEGGEGEMQNEEC